MRSGGLDDAAEGGVIGAELERASGPEGLVDDRVDEDAAGGDLDGGADAPGVLLRRERGDGKVVGVAFSEVEVYGGLGADFVPADLVVDGVFRFGRGDVELWWGAELAEEHAVECVVVVGAWGVVRGEAYGFGEDGEHHACAGAHAAEPDVPADHDAIGASGLMALAWVHEEGDAGGFGGDAFDGGHAAENGLARGEFEAFASLGERVRDDRVKPGTVVEARAEGLAVAFEGGFGADDDVGGRAAFFRGPEEFA